LKSNGKKQRLRLGVKGNAQKKSIMYLGTKR